jgi:hypothetical protein
MHLLKYITKIIKLIVVIQTHCPEYCINLTAALNLLRNTTYLTCHANVYTQNSHPEHKI